MEIRWVNVPVATVWTLFDSARDLDAKAIENPADVSSWLQNQTYEELLALCEKNLVQTQCLYGEEVLILEEKEGWSHIFAVDQPSSKDKRGYPGWIPTQQLIKNDSFSLANKPIAVVTAKKATLYSEEQIAILELSYQTRLPYVSEENGYLKVETPMGQALLRKEEVTVFSSLQAIPKGNGQDIVAAGEQFLDLPYLWGGMSSYGYDCSGFSYSMCKANGYIIPRDAHDQAAKGEEVDLNQLLPGDLLFFAYEEGKGAIHHVGIYYGNGKMLHSPKTGKTVEIIELKETVYEKELCAARRYWQNTEE
ncbi:C40 family peptidase [Peribacillus tepidiphilus]|uniref:C40 family peptidase n=1 Tax=Peribacillus tepidiphilus TaxID=2652445 RepID=UPI001291A2E1|nr:C40 family peptidase [Peribacillus tepidiphilus]